MQEALPCYYHKFKCIADRCTHSCCIGWEIAIDEETLELYSSIEGDFGGRIRESILPDSGCFALGQDDRCPFLNQEGLCDIICHYGEDALCDICYLHPRFKNFYPSFTEIGLGLACEEAARIILFDKEKFSIPVPQGVLLSAEEEKFFKTRQEIFDILQNREKSIKSRFAALAEKFGLAFPTENTAGLYLSLERLCQDWTYELESLKDSDFSGGIFEDESLGLFFEQLAVYFVFRHLSDALWDDDYTAPIRFALTSCALIGAVLTRDIREKGGADSQRLADVARMYSAEVEYSDENLGKMMV